ncbi:DUF5134 domain-containing protein [Arthrobacter sp. NPDC058127]|uniref:DUF5134 domain-containing protein n=1 Tax=Arthrobacter sp. NPDC058127 TaxID=3346351 RepID=UPI0036ED8ED4
MDRDIATFMYVAVLVPCCAYSLIQAFRSGWPGGIGHGFHAAMSLAMVAMVLPDGFVAPLVQLVFFSSAALWFIIHASIRARYGGVGKWAFGDLGSGAMMGAMACMIAMMCVTRSGHIGHADLAATAGHSHGGSGYSSGNTPGAAIGMLGMAAPLAAVFLGVAVVQFSGLILHMSRNLVQRPGNAARQPQPHPVGGRLVNLGATVTMAAMFASMFFGG